MNRHTYQKLRRAARIAARAWWQSAKDPYATNYDRDRAWSAMHDATKRVPGGVSLPCTPPVMLDGWFWRRADVGRRMTNRKAQAQIQRALGFMSARFIATEWREAA